MSPKGFTLWDPFMGHSWNDKMQTQGRDCCCHCSEEVDTGRKLVWCGTEHMHAALEPLPLAVALAPFCKQQRGTGPVTLCTCMWISHFLDNKNEWLPFTRLRIIFLFHFLASRVLCLFCFVFVFFCVNLELRSVSVSWLVVEIWGSLNTVTF